MLLALYILDRLKTDYIEFNYSWKLAVLRTFIVSCAMQMRQTLPL